ncbi:MAG: DNA repair protein RecO [Spirochaetaceae bacterium]|jgi:DNA repair protein RecO (recombination protein O)|nr:DNA repair protein RecO [Spirochaetaceae bacterium]
MTRNFKAELVILKSWPMKETHRSLKALSPQLGLISLIQFGGQSSKKGRRKGAESFCYGLGQLYKEPRYEGWQLKDFQLIHGFQENREDLKKIYILSLMAETMLITHGGGGDSIRAFNLLKDSFSLLEKADEDSQSDRVLIRYILKFLDLLGLGDFYNCCSTCGRGLMDSEPLFYDGDGSHCCPHCAGQNMMPLAPGARIFLQRISQGEPELIFRVSLTQNLHITLKDWMLSMLQHHMPRALKTLQSGGIFL